MTALDQIRKRRRRWVKRQGKHILRSLYSFLGRQSLVGDYPVFDNSPFPWTRELENNWEPIQKELYALLKVREHLPSFHEVSPDQKKISLENHWKTFIFYGFGYKSERNCQRCPETSRTLNAIPNLKSAWFSILSPHYHIPPHRGVTKGVIRCHLGLVIPDNREKCVMRVDDQICQWEEGKCLVFDDTYDHEVKNDTDQQRVVLIIDVTRPMRLPGRFINSLLMQGIKWTAYVQDARKNLTAWEDRFESAVRRADAYEDNPS